MARTETGSHRAEIRVRSWQCLLQIARLVAEDLRVAGRPRSKLPMYQRDEAARDTAGQPGLEPEGEGDPAAAHAKRTWPIMRVTNTQPTDDSRARGLPGNPRIVPDYFSTARMLDERPKPRALR